MTAPAEQGFPILGYPIPGHLRITARGTNLCIIVEDRSFVSATRVALSFRQHQNDLSGIIKTGYRGGHCWLVQQCPQ